MMAPRREQVQGESALSLSHSTLELLSRSGGTVRRREGNDENGKRKGGAMKNENGRMKGDSNGEDEKMRAENGRIKSDPKERTKQFALNIIAVYSQLPKRRETQVLGDQPLRSGTSVGARSSELDMRKVLLSSSRQTALVRPLWDR
jgi:hypothetical protein